MSSHQRVSVLMAIYITLIWFSYGRDGSCLNLRFGPKLHLSDSRVDLRLVLKRLQGSTLTWDLGLVKNLYLSILWFFFGTDKKGGRIRMSFPPLLSHVTLCTWWCLPVTLVQKQTSESFLYSFSLKSSSTFLKQQALLENNSYKQSINCKSL